MGGTFDSGLPDETLRRVFEVSTEFTEARQEPTFQVGRWRTSVHIGSLILPSVVTSSFHAKMAWWWAGTEAWIHEVPRQ